MNEFQPLLNEYIARKDQVLNLETRIFALVIVFEILFIVFYALKKDIISKTRISKILSFSVLLFFFFELVAINGKMGLISMYLRQLETYLMNNGFKGIIWETIALDKIIFVLGNAFTFPAFLSILTLFFQIVYSFNFMLSDIKHNKIYTIVFTILLLLILVKSFTVDFGTQLPQIF